MEALVASFALGVASAASPCLLPLYPAFLAMLVGRQGDNAKRAHVGRSSDWSSSSASSAPLILVGAAVTLLSVSLSPLLAFIVPATTFVLLVLGVLMLAGRNPFARLATIGVPVVKRPLAQAYVYGLAFGPVALPCAGPFVIALLAISIGVAETATRLLGFVAFGLGLGLPLIAISLVGAVRARSVAGWLTRHHRPLMRISGALLIIAAFAEPVATVAGGHVRSPSDRATLAA